MGVHNGHALRLTRSDFSTYINACKQLKKVTLDCRAKPSTIEMKEEKKLTM